MKDLNTYKTIIKEYSKNAYKKLMRRPMRRLAHPFIVPGAVYQYELWDWDSWLTDVGVEQIITDLGGEGAAEFSECQRGCILNFLENIDGSGKIPIMINGECEPIFITESKNAAKPCLAQHLAFILKNTGEDISWISGELPKLDLFIDWYEKTSLHEPTGLYVFLDDTAIGVDNDPSIFYRPCGSTASIYLNSLMYRELLAMSYIWRLAGNAEKAESYKLKAEKLSESINEHLYDEKCGMYYSADVNLLPIEPEKFLHSGCPRHWHSLIMRIDSWSGFMALWAGIAPPERARRVIEENMLNPNTFFGQYGIRSLSKLEKMFENIPSGNPSCWLGPMWAVANYMCFKSLLAYGYEKEAKELANTLVYVFGKDIDECGEMHEYYHCDSGKGLNNRGFQSWNLLINNMIAYLDGGRVISEF